LIVTSKLLRPQQRVRQVNKQQCCGNQTHDCFHKHFRTHRNLSHARTYAIAIRKNATVTAM